MMDVFHVLRPTKALVEWLKERDVPAWMDLYRPHVWSEMGFHGDHDYVGQGEDGVTFLKLAVLANFLDRLESATLASSRELEAHDAVTRRVLTELLGPPPLTVETFDRWWVLECAEGLHSVESTLAHTPVRTLRQVRGPEQRSPTVEAHRSSYAAIAISGGPRPVGAWWDDAIRARDEDAPRLQCAVSWVLERLAEKTPHRTCSVWTRAFSLDVPVEDVLHVPGWTLHGRDLARHEGIQLTLENFEWGLETWTFAYQVYAGARRAALSGAAYLELEKDEHGWKVRSGSLKP
ncbi:hypothetical protein [Pyxidicoccus trucidator]|uniref:hypothetical protein n=1 Tax=Pyxidicoccus trucidator TaxID=2709662 RepID=UPI001F07DD55|nr:hypothetical protein [Pyxidicoccus trucidator]